MSRHPRGPFDGRHAVVTGGGRGIGAAIAAVLAERGADLTLMGRNRSRLDGQVEEIRNAGGGRIQAVVCDVSDARSVEQAFAEAVGSQGGIQMLVNNAGVSEAAPSGEVTLEAWNRTLAVNLTGTFLCIQQVLPAMIASGAGRIVNISSVAGLKGFAGVAAYCASKHGVVGLTRSLAIEAAPSGVTVNAVCPGYTVDTDMFRTAVSNVMARTGRSESEARAVLARHSRRGTPVTLREVADTVAWLCSDEASAITGQAVAVAAGEVM